MEGTKQESIRIVNTKPPEYTTDEMSIIELYRKADDYDKATINLVLARYKEYRFEGRLVK